MANIRDVCFSPEVATDVSGVLMFLHFLMALYVASRDIEWTQRLRFLWNHQVQEKIAKSNEEIHTTN